MPFFCKTLKKSVETGVTLQVRIPQTEMNKDRKRVSFSASASLTLEAALVLPLLLYAGVILITLFRVMDIHRQVQARVEKVGGEISQAAYMLEYTGTGSFLGTVSAYGYAEAALGRVFYGVGSQEESSVVFRRSIFAVQDIEAGEAFTRENIRIIRPGYGDRKSVV